MLYQLTAIQKSESGTLFIEGEDGTPLHIASSGDLTASLADYYKTTFQKAIARNVYNEDAMDELHDIKDSLKSIFADGAASVKFDINDFSTTAARLTVSHINALIDTIEHQEQPLEDKGTLDNCSYGPSDFFRDLRSGDNASSEELKLSSGKPADPNAVNLD